MPYHNGRVLRASSIITHQPDHPSLHSSLFTRSYPHVATGDFDGRGGDTYAVVFAFATHYSIPANLDMKP